MTHPIVYAGSAAIGSGVLVLGLIQTPPTARVAEITAFGEIVQMVLIAVAPLLAAWVAWKIQQAKVAADLAATIAQKTLEKAQEVATQGAATADKVNGHWSAIEKKLEKSDRLNEIQAALIETLTAKLALADKDTAVALTEKAAVEKASQVKELTEARAAYPGSVVYAPAPAPPAPVGTIAAVTEAAKTIVEAVPQLDSIEKTGEATHGIVTEIKGKP